MRRVLIAFALSLNAFSALAHAQLQSASPPVGGAVAPPSELRLRFSEGVEPKFSSVTLSGGAALGKPTVTPGDDRTLVVPIPLKLAPGVYTVKWRVMSVDTHRTQGEYEFTVRSEP